MYFRVFDFLLPRDWFNLTEDDFAYLCSLSLSLSLSLIFLLASLACSLDLTRYSGSYRRSQGLAKTQRKFLNGMPG
jgi:hypothetical protein